MSSALSIAINGINAAVARATQSAGNIVNASSTGKNIVTPKLGESEKQRSWAIFEWEGDFYGGVDENMSQREDGTFPRTAHVN